MHLAERDAKVITSMRHYARSMVDKNKAGSHNYLGYLPATSNVRVSEHVPSIFSSLLPRVAFHSPRLERNVEARITGLSYFVVNITLLVDLNGSDRTEISSHEQILIIRTNNTESI